MHNIYNAKAKNVPVRFFYDQHSLIDQLVRKNVSALGRACKIRRLMRPASLEISSQKTSFTGFGGKIARYPQLSTPKKSPHFGYPPMCRTKRCS